MSRIRVFIVEDDPHWREGISEYIAGEDDLTIVGEAATVKEALERLQAGSCDVALVDLHLGHAAFEGIQVIREAFKHSGLKVIALSSLDGMHLIGEAIASGAVNYVTKPNVADISKAIRDAHAGRASIHHSSAYALRGEHARIRMNVSEQELQLLALVKEGCSIRDIAERTHYEPQSIKNALGKLARKLNFRRFGEEVVKYAKLRDWLK